MPRDNRAFQKGYEVAPDWVPPDELHLFPGLGQGPKDWVPDPGAPLEVEITPEQERYGLAYKPGDPIPRRKPVEPFLRNDGFRDHDPDEVRLKEPGKGKKDAAA